MFLFLYILFDTTIDIFNAVYNFIFNKSCFNDSLISLYLLSSPLFTIGLLISILIYLLINIYKYIQSIIFCIFILSFGYYLNKCINNTFITNYLNINNINTTLQNGLLNIHPIFIYIIYSYTTIFWIFNYKFYFCNYRLDTTTKKHNLILIVITGICLGAIWASQELNWGGFWSWDPVELVSLFFFFWLIFYFHNRSNKYLNKPINNIIIIIMLIFFIIRVGVVSTIHSFILNSLKTVFINISIYIFIFFTIINIFFYYWIYNKYYINNYLILFWILLLYLYVYLILLIISSNTKLLNICYTYFFITYLSIYCIYLFNFNIYIYIVSIVYVCFINSYYFLLFLFNVLFIYSLITLNYIYIHWLYVILYFIFFIFFVSINVYKINFISLITWNIHINNTINAYILDNFYEISYFLKKHVHLNTLKTFLFHISGFSIKTNILVGFNLFSKNNLIIYVFSLEIIYILILYLIIFYILNYFNYFYNFIKNISTKY